MKILFTKDLSGVAKKNEIKELSDGYAKNFIIAKGFGVIATEQLINKFNNEQKQQTEKAQRQEKHFLDLKADFDKRTFTIPVKVGDKMQVFGSVHEVDVLKKILEKTSVELNKKQVVLPKHIKQLGEYPIEVKFTNKIIAKPKIKLINKENNEAEK